MIQTEKDLICNCGENILEIGINLGKLKSLIVEENPPDYLEENYVRAGSTAANNIVESMKHSYKLCDINFDNEIKLTQDIDAILWPVKHQLPPRISAWKTKELLTKIDHLTVAIHKKIC